QGERCPTFQNRVDFEMEGPGVWRGGYNSGKIKSINNSYLDLECGINRVAIRSTLSEGQIVVRATSAGLRPAEATLISRPVKIEGGTTPSLPAMPIVKLSSQQAGAAMGINNSGILTSDFARPTIHHGKYLMNLSYSGPSKGVHIESDAEAGKTVYVDHDETFADMPQALCRSDWIQAAFADRLYSAVDLMEIPVPAHSVIYVAHDNRLDRPAWLRQQFEPTEMSLVVGGKPMKVYRRIVETERSFTLGSNTDQTQAEECNMYLVFINASPD
ncbi:MAG TPA: hypothetical protein VMJ32_06215, partial [Pirellulales bacterium]|nr:hypothetical protein [Pirellulales bacterium]